MADGSPCHRFGDLVLDPTNRRLTRAGAEISLQPKAFDTLLFLVERHGSLVTKRALLETIWFETAVTDNALTQQISELREALGDEARRPRFIRTIPRLGFTFVAAVERTSASLGSGDSVQLICEIGGACRRVTPRIERGMWFVGWSADDARVFYLQRTSQPGWGELKSVDVAGGAARAHGSFGPLRPYELCVDVSPRDEVVFAPYAEGPHELWMAQLR
jgi:DNA-binding winged helix-turn-helix (wHTH) protein